MSASDAPEPEAVIAQIQERRKDTAFTERLAAQVAADRPLLNRLAGHSCPSTSASLVESRDGGAMLVYRCDLCGASLIRTREQAEQQAVRDE